jgi:hypothetical protein
MLDMMVEERKSSERSLQRSWKTLLRKDWREVESLAGQDYEMRLRFRIAQAALVRSPRMANQPNRHCVIRDYSFHNSAQKSLIWFEIYASIIHQNHQVQLSHHSYHQPQNARQPIFS